jgi:hypothetical protein
MSGVPSRQARLVHAAKHAELWNAEKTGFDAATGDGNLLIKTYYPMPEHVGAESDPYAHLREGR